MKGEKTYSADTLIVIALICAFTASVLMTLLLGTRIYGSMKKNSYIAYNERIGLSYIAEKLRHGDEKDAVYTGDFDGINALFIENKLDDIIYTNILYCYDGWIYELFCEKGSDFSRNDGAKILEAELVSFSEMQSGLFYIELIDISGNINRHHISLRSGG